MAAKDRIQALVSMIANKLNAINIQLSNFAPKGVSTDAGNNLSLGSDNKPFFKKRTASEIATEYENLSNTNKFSDNYKNQLDNLNIDFTNKLDRGGYEGTAEDLKNLLSKGLIPDLPINMTSNESQEYILPQNANLYAIRISGAATVKLGTTSGGNEINEYSPTKAVVWTIGFRNEESVFFTSDTDITITPMIFQW